MKILWLKLLKYFNVADSIAALSSCKLCRRIAFVVFVAILFIEGAILIPSVVNFERDLLKRLELEGFQTVQSIFRLSVSDAQPAELLVAANKQMGKSKLKGGALFSKEGKLLGKFGEQIEIDGNFGANPTMHMKEVTSGQRYEIVWAPENTGYPYFIIARLDSSWIRTELIAFVGRIIGLVF